MAGRLQTERMTKLDVEKVMDVVKTRADSIVTFLHSGLSKVYSGAERDEIESIHTLPNLQVFTRAVQRSVFVIAAAIHYKSQEESAKLLQPDLLIFISSEELRTQFGCLLELDNKQILSLLIHHHHSLY